MDVLGLECFRLSFSSIETLWGLFSVNGFVWARRRDGRTNCRRREEVRRGRRGRACGAGCLLVFLCMCVCSRSSSRCHTAPQTLTSQSATATRLSYFLLLNICLLAASEINEAVGHEKTKSQLGQTTSTNVSGGDAAEPSWRSDRSPRWWTRCSDWMITERSLLLLDYFCCFLNFFLGTQPAARHLIQTRRVRGNTDTNGPPGCFSSWEKFWFQTVFNTNLNLHAEIRTF